MKNKKGFTIVELVIVIAVIAILASVLVPTFSSIILKAQRSADTQVVRMLNEYVKIDLSEKGETKHNTMYDAVRSCIDNGLSPDKISAKSDLKIAWESTTGNFVLLETATDSIFFPIDENTNEVVQASNPTDYFVVTTYDSSIEKGEFKYSVYAYGNDWPSTLNISTGFDCGSVSGFKEIIFNEKLNKKLMIRTNECSTMLVINGNSQTEIEHYGFAGYININNVGSNSFNENGSVLKFNIEEGHLHLLNGSAAYHIDASVNSYISVDSNATVYNSNGEKINTELSYDNKTFVDNSNQNNLLKVAKPLSASSSECLHNETKVIADFFGLYEVCLYCGNTLITIVDEKTNETYKCTVIKDDECELIPMGVYLSSQITETYSFKEGFVELKTDDDGEYVKPAVYESPEFTYKQINCKHANWNYIQNNDDYHRYHNVVCASCNYEYVQYHSFVNSVCSICNYKCEDHKNIWHSDVECSQAGNATLSCTYCHKFVEERSFQAGEHLWDEETHTCLRNNTEAYLVKSTKDYSIMYGFYFYFEKVSEKKNEGYEHLYCTFCGDTISFWGTETNKKIPHNLSGWSEYGDIDECIRNFDNSIYYDYSETPNVVIQPGITSIEKYAFSSYITSIKPDVYHLKIKKITLPEGLTYIGVGAFRYTTALEEVVFPSTLPSIDADAFKGTSLKNTNIPIANNVSIGETDFISNEQLENITLAATFPPTGYTDMQIYSRCSKSKNISIKNKQKIKL